MNKLIALILLLAPFTARSDISFASVGSTGSAGSGNCVPGAPGSIQNNDILLLQVVSDDQISHSVDNGYTQIVQGNGAGDFQRMSLWWKRTTGTETLTTVTHSAGRAITCKIIAFRGVEETGTPINVASASIGGNCTAASSAASITTTANNALLAHFTGNQGGCDMTYSGWSSPATNEAWDTCYNAPEYVHAALSYGIQATAGASGAQTATIAGIACNSSALVALTPETGTVTPPPAASVDVFPDWNEIAAYVEFGNATNPNSVGSSADCGLLLTDLGTGGTRLGNVKAITLFPYNYVRLSARFANTTAQTGTVSCRLFNLTDSQDLTGGFKDINNTTNCVTSSYVISLPTLTDGMKRVVCECKSSVATDDPNFAWCVGEFF